MLQRVGRRAISASLGRRQVACVIPAACAPKLAQSNTVASQRVVRLQLGAGAFAAHGRRNYAIKRFSKDDVEAVRAARGRVGQGNSTFNIPVAIEEKIGRNLHLQRNHPLNTIKTLIENYFRSEYAPAQGTKLACYDNLSPIVTVKQNFDDLLTPADHVSRRVTDTYYLDENTLLRCHTSAHQIDLLTAAEAPVMLCSGDVYRRDEIDTSHFPVFHQMEGLRIFYEQDIANLRAAYQMPTATEEQLAVEDLKRALEGMVDRLFGKVEKRWVDAYFPFTTPSLELEILYNGKWMEVLGCGVVQQTIMNNSGHSTRKGWAFGLGLERLAMVLFDISDIRLFWSTDQRFLSQFEEGKIIKFKPFSKMPACFKDVSFWVPKTFHENDFYEIVRSVAGEVVEDVKLVSKFTHPKTGRESHCYRINYRDMERTLRNEEVDEMQEKVKQAIVSDLKVELR